MVALVLLVVVVGTVAVWFVLRGGGTASVTTFTVREETTAGGSTVLNASGYVEARQRATVASRVTGRLVELNVEEGMPVEVGFVLARLDDSLFRAALGLAESQLVTSGSRVEETRVELQLARLTLARTRKLLREEVVGQAELDDALTRVKSFEARIAREQEEIRVAEREVALRRAELDDTVIRAPFDGIVISKDANVGEMVSPVSAGGGFTRTGICTLVDMSSLEIEVDVNEAYISRVHAGQSVEAVLDAYPDWRIPAHVITTIPAADRQKATVEVRIGFDELDPRILPDMGIKVAFHEVEAATPDDARPRVRIPVAAVRRDGEHDVVFVEVGGQVSRRAVTLGMEIGDRVEVVAGLRDGERVIVDGPADLADGDTVKTK